MVSEAENRWRNLFFYKDKGKILRGRQTGISV